MSWQQYIDDSLIGSGQMHSAAIVGLNDGSYWAYGGTYIPQPEEVKHILACIKNPELVQKSGVTVYGVKFFGLRSDVDGDTRYIFFKKGESGGCVYTTKQAFIIGIYGNPAHDSALLQDIQKTKHDKVVNPADCNATVKRVAEYLIKLGY